MAELVHRELHGAVGIVTFDRPDRHNAMDDEMSEQARQAIRWALAEPAARAVLLRGVGKSFCSGRDTTQLGHRAGGETDFEFVQRAQQIRLEMIECQKPIVAAVQGAALGGGMEIALAADVRIADTTAKFGLPEVGFGLVTDTGGSYLLPRLIGASKAKLMLITGERIDAQTALAWGVVDRLVEPTELQAAALALAERFAAAPPLAAAMAKQLVDKAMVSSPRDAFTAELHAQVALFASADYQEIKTARREGRPPVLGGR
jgi:enoyl-CoA hydratase